MMVRSNLRRLVAVAATFGMLMVAAPATAGAAGGTALGWGYNGSGQVGQGSLEPGSVESPRPLLGVSEVVEIAAGYEFGLALMADGRVMSWGYNYSGELGNGTTNLNPVPTLVPGVSNAVAVAADTASALVLLGDGTILAWGENGSGELGLGPEAGPEKCLGGGYCSKVPVRVPGISNAIAVAGGEYHSLALLADGTVLAWGENQWGEQGDGVGTASGCKCIPTPTPVPGVSGAIAITAGAFTNGAVLAGGTALNWGRNHQGELGTGTTAPASGCECLGPVTPAGLLGVREFSSGGKHSLALRQGTGVVGWGYNYSGELGIEAESGSPCYCVAAPVSVGSLSGARTVDAGDEHSGALMADGSIRTWGSNDYGQIGTGPLNENVLAPKSVPGVSGASALTASPYNTYAIIGPSQTLRVEFAGDEAGFVGGRGIVCPPECAQQYPQAQVEPLRAEPAARFAGFTGPCAGTGTCLAKMDGDQTVTATFGRPKGTTITRAKVVPRKRLATFSFSAPGAVTGYECMLVSRGHHRKRAGRSAKKRKRRFTGCTSPRRYRHLKPTRYTFRVRALDILGADTHPAKRKFRLRTPKRR
jgi:alpha-tubulin suppressor-like RCC1 family protein